jgi:hypothetical protein
VTDWNNNVTPINDSITGSLTRTPGINAGTYAILIGALSAGANYSVAYTGANFVINPAALTITNINANNKTYDGNSAATLNLISGIINGIQYSDSLTLNQSGYIANFASVGPGNNIPVLVSNVSVSGSAASNYIVTQPTGLTANITGAVPPAPPSPPEPVIQAGLPSYQTVFPMNLINSSNGANGSQTYLYTYSDAMELQNTIVIYGFVTTYEMRNENDNSTEGNTQCSNIAGKQLCNTTQLNRYIFDLPGHNNSNIKNDGNIDTQ